MLPKEQLERLDPQNRIKAETEIGNQRQISYTIDLTREYHNLLERSEGDSTQTYFWDGNVASYEENGQGSFYLQDELGSPLRIEDETGRTRESYGYGVFGEDLYDNQGELQPFGYTGYQKDRVAGTYYAQAREYQPSIGRFNSEDIIGGFILFPDTLNHYIYCWNNSELYVDYNGKWPTIVIGAVAGFVSSLVSSAVSGIVTGNMDPVGILVDAAGGAAQGAILGSGIGLVAGAVTTGLVGAATNVTKQIAVEKKSIEEIDWLSATAEGVFDGVTYGYGRYKINKAIKKGDLNTSDLMKRDLLNSEDEIADIRGDLAKNYPIKRRKGKSYKRKVRKLNKLKGEKKLMEKKWIRELAIEGAQNFIPENTYKKWSKNILISMVSGEQALFNIVDKLINDGKLDIDSLKECIE